jgi:hypothetical protein
MNQDDEVLLPPNFPHVLDYIGGAAAIAPFVFSYTTSATSTVNGEIASAYTHNWTALVGGGIALLVGVGTLALLRSTPRDARSKRIGATAALVLLGLFHLVARSGFVL